MRLSWRHSAESDATTTLGVCRNPRPGPGPANAATAKATSRVALVDAMVRSHRSALLLRPKIADDIAGASLQPAIDCFRQATCLVSAGPTQLHRWQVDAEVSDIETPATDRIDVDAFFLQRCTVTNQQFQAFVNGGGYIEKSLWHASVWPHVQDLVDRSGVNGPRFWSDGQHAVNESEHPVVGISWFEAEAYSRWIGMRLPTDAEWVRAACTPIETNGAITQRRYPWGDSFANDRANLWGSNIGCTVATGSYPTGDALGGPRQMVGNVWEWTSGDLQLWHDTTLLELTESMKSLRGGAFDSYLDVRATCQCQSADGPLTRKPNIGFRCVVSVDDVVDLDRDELDSTQLATDEVTA